jgi:hypothetical protein
MRKDEKREVTPEFVNMSKEILYPQIQGVTIYLMERLHPSNYCNKLCTLGTIRTCNRYISFYHVKLEF